jgi:hypothetical protein
LAIQGPLLTLQRPEGAAEVDDDAHPHGEAVFTL